MSVEDKAYQWLMDMNIYDLLQIFAPKDPFYIYCFISSNNSFLVHKLFTLIW